MESITVLGHLRYLLRKMGWLVNCYETLLSQEVEAFDGPVSDWVYHSEIIQRSLYPLHQYLSEDVPGKWTDQNVRNLVSLETQVRLLKDRAEAADMKAAFRLSHKIQVMVELWDHQIETTYFDRWAYYGNMSKRLSNREIESPLEWECQTLSEASKQKLEAWRASIREEVTWSVRSLDSEFPVLRIATARALVAASTKRSIQNELLFASAIEKVDPNLTMSLAEWHSRVVKTLSSSKAKTLFEARWRTMVDRLNSDLVVHA